MYNERAMSTPSPQDDVDLSPYAAKRVEINGTLVQPHDTVKPEDMTYALALNIQDPYILDPAFRLWYTEPPSKEQAMKDLRLLARQEAVLPQWREEATERLEAILEMIEVVKPFYNQRSFKDMGTPYRDCADVERVSILQHVANTDIFASSRSTRCWQAVSFRSTGTLRTTLRSDLGDPRRSQKHSHQSPAICWSRPAESLAAIHRATSQGPPATRSTR